MNTLLRTCVVSTMMLLLAACTGMIPMYNLYGQRVPGDLTEEEVGKAIELAAIKAGWRPEVVRPGYMRSILDIRGHTVLVNIHYTRELYSIDYNSSYQMKVYCRGKRKKNQSPVVTTGPQTCPGSEMPAYIHGNYKDWIDNLNASILVALETVRSQGT